MSLVIKWMLNIWGEFLSRPVVRALTVTAKGPGSVLGWGTEIPQGACCGPKKKKNEFLKPVLLNV